MTTSTRPDSTAARTSTLDRPTVMALAGTEYERFGELLDALEPGDWQAPTSCPGWDVRAMADSWKT